MEKRSKIRLTWTLSETALAAFLMVSIAENWRFVCKERVIKRDEFWMKLDVNWARLFIVQIGNVRFSSLSA